MKAHYQMFAAYNRWANRLLLAGCRELSADEYHRNLKGMYGSVNGTLNHQYIADVVWLHRFTGEGDPPYAFDDIPFNLLSDFSAARAVLDERIISFVDLVDEDVLASTILYRTIQKPLIMEQPLGSAIAHFFNQQAELRGQVKTLLAQLGREPAEIELIHFQRETGIGMAADPVAARLNQLPSIASN